MEANLLPALLGFLTALPCSLYHKQVQPATAVLFWPSARFTHCLLLWCCHAHSLHGFVPSPHEACDSWPYGPYRFCLLRGAITRPGLPVGGGGGGGRALLTGLPGDCQPRLSSALLTCEATAAHCRPDVGTHLQLSRDDADDGGALQSSTCITMRQQLRIVLPSVNHLGGC